MQNNSVNKCIFHFLGARIWAPMLGYRHENPSGYVTGTYNKWDKVLKNGPSKICGKHPLKIRSDMFKQILLKNT